MSDVKVNEETYSHMTQHESILKRPSTYIGSISTNEEEHYIFNNESNPIIKNKCQYNPGLIKLFDEILVNAIDHSAKNDTVTKIDVIIEDGCISVTNNGPGIPIKKQVISENGTDIEIYIPEMICSRLLTSSNYDDTKERTVGGTNGVGLKAVGIFSTRFTVDTVDSNRKLHYIQEFSDNMYTIKPPKISKYTKVSFTKITFYPDLARFKMKCISDDIFNIMKRRVYDATACTHKRVTVSFNGEKIKCKEFIDYTKLFFDTDQKRKPDAYELFEIGNYIWEVAAYKNDSFQHMTFVNGINTIKGGKHLEYISKQISKKLSEMIISKKKIENLKPKYIEDHLFLFIRSTINQPEFDNQSKETLTTPVSKFFAGNSVKGKIEISDAFITKLYKCGIVEDIINLTNFKNQKELVKTTNTSKKNKITGIPKLDDAQFAGTLKSKDCYLFITEGDSAKTLAVAGITSIPGSKDYYGVYPVRGKILNVREATHSQQMKNIIILDIIKIIGLTHKKVYNEKNISELRYAGIIALSDQDSVSGDTPLLLKDKFNQIVIKNIEDLTNNFEDPELNLVNKFKNTLNIDENNVNSNKKEYGYSDYQVWTETGWTNIQKVIRHKISKKMFRVLTHTGCVDVTEDHSLLNENSEKIKPNDCKIGQKLLHDFPIFEENKIIIPNNLEKLTGKELWIYASKLKIPYYQLIKKNELIILLNNYKNNIGIKLNNESDIDIDEAYVMGLFLADGSGDIYKFQTVSKNKNRPRAYTFNRVSYSWHIDNTDITLLEKCLYILERIYGYWFKILTLSSKGLTEGQKYYRLILNGGKKSGYIIEKYRRLFYYKKYKYIHPDLLNANRQIREQILIGYYDGDGLHDLSKPKCFDINSKITSQCLFFLSKSLGYEVSINHNIKKEKVYTMSITKGFLQKNVNIIKKIIELDTSNSDDFYVYDLQTENHHFQAGVGQMIVHNTDGFHIMGLLFNVFSYWWPSLLEVKGFLRRMNTPIVKITMNKQIIECFTLKDYQNHLNEIVNKKFKSKYYKGLGTFTSKEAVDIFKRTCFKLNNTDSKKISLVNYISDSPKSTQKSIELAFKKELANERKQWILDYNPEREVDTNQNISYSDFINFVLIIFSVYDNVRSIPSLVDGLKVSQRKIMYTVFLKNYKEEIKVARLSADTSGCSNYHHGEASLNSTIINMAQNYIGSNNWNLLIPNGQFGTRRQGGKDSAAERYIFTEISNYSKKLFNKTDFNILKLTEDDGQFYEPTFYVPILPIILINGTKGIGTGFSTDIPCFNPIDIINNMKRIINNQEQIEMKPWYTNFKGEIKKESEHKFTSYGVMKLTSDGKGIKISELPIKHWTEDTIEYYKELVNNNTHGLSDIKEYCDDLVIDITLTFKSKDLLKKFLSKSRKDIFKDLKLSSTINTSNMTLFDCNGKLKKYDSAEDILEEFVGLRLKYNIKRKKYIIDSINHKLISLKNKIRFLEDIMSETLVIFKRKKDDIYKELEQLKYDKINGSFSYLTDMNILSFTYEIITKYKKESDELHKELTIISEKTTTDILLDDLEEFEN